MIADELKRIFIPGCLKEEEKDIQILLEPLQLKAVFFNDLYPYEDEIQPVAPIVKRNAVFNQACAGALKYNAVAIPEWHLNDPESGPALEQVINYCSSQDITVLIFNNEGKCIRVGIWNPDFKAYTGRN